MEQPGNTSKYEEKFFPIIIKHLESCRPEEVGQHAERAVICVNEHNAERFKQVLLKRTAAPSLKDVKNFETLKSLGVNVGIGALICFVDTPLPLSENSVAVPLAYL